MKKVLSIVLAIACLLTSCLGLASCSKADSNTFTWLLSQGVDEMYLSSYNVHPVIKWFLSKEYNGNTLDIDFKTMVAGSEKDQFQTMISTGDYYDVLDVAYSAYSVETLYNMGIAMDLTELIEQYMPNYKAFIAENDEVRMSAYTIIDGEKKMLQIVAGGDVANTFEGYMYRRDWLLKYGTNPQTGEPFTGGYTAKDEGGKNDANSWVDDIVFPSWYSDNKYVTTYKAAHPEWDGTDPVFISDWEWMFEIFEKAFADLGITDSYILSIPYNGYNGMGDLFSSFGGGGPTWTKKNGEVVFNVDSDSTRAYLECVRNWYDKGWLDEEFDERSSDMFWKIDVPMQTQGKVPVMCSGAGSIGSNKDTSEYPLTDGIMLYPMRLPINDVYGTESTKGVEPDCLYQGSAKTGSIIITSNAEGKDLATLLTFIDYLYSEEGIRTSAMGLNKEQYEEIKDSLEKDGEGLDIMQRYDLTDGAYTEKDGKYYRAKVVEYGGYLQMAISNDRMSVGRNMNSKIAFNNSMTEKAYSEWMLYRATADVYVYDDFFDEDQSKTYNRTANMLNDKMAVEIPKFIKGEYNMDSDFNTFIKTINKMGHEKVTKILSDVMNKYA